MKKRYCAVLLLLVVLALLIAGCGQKKDAYPNRNIVAVVGFNPGGPTDVIARGILPIVQEELGVSITVNNMPGAASATAANHVLSQAKDGYTVFFGSEIMSIWQTMGTADLHPTRDFIPVKIVSEAIPVLAVPPNSPFNSAQEFVEYAKANPGELRIGTAGPGTVPHISGLLLQRYLGTEFTFVPFEGGKPAVTAVMGAQVDATIEMVQSMVSAYESGDLRILASFTNEPIEGLEEIEPFGKIYPEVAQHLPYGPYFGLFVATGTPDEVVKVLEEAMDKAIKDERWIEYCDNMFLVRVDYSGDAAVKYLEDWTSRSAWLLYDSGGGEHSPEEFGIKRPE